MTCTAYCGVMPHRYFAAQRRAERAVTARIRAEIDALLRDLPEVTFDVPLKYEDLPPIGGMVRTHRWNGWRSQSKPDNSKPRRKEHRA